MNGTAVLIERSDTQTHNIDLLVKAWLISYSSADTRQTYWMGISAFLDWCRSFNLYPLAAGKTHFAAYLRYIETLPWKPNTRAIRFTAVRSFFAWCFDEEVIDGNPCARVKGPPSVRSHDLPWANSHQLRELNHAAKKVLSPDALAAWNLMCCAMRAGEVGRADHEHMHSRDYVHYLHVYGKGQRERTILVPPQAMAAFEGTGRTSGPIALNEWGNRMSQANLAAVVRRVGKAARLEHLRMTPHALRRSWASITLDQGQPIREVQRYLGHASVSVTERYDRRPDEALKSPAWTFQAAVA